MKTIESYREKSKVLAKGAEAYVYKITFGGCDAVLKVRYPKKYRHPKVDLSIRDRRTRNESLNMIRALKAGINVPTLYYVDLNEFSIVMEYIKGEPLTLNLTENNIRKAGKTLAELHNNDIAHWDYTTSNILITKDDKLYVIDFGLSIYTKSLLDKAIDVHLMNRSLRAIVSEAEPLISIFWEEYSRTVKDPDGIKEMLQRVESMGRYVKSRRKTVW